MRYKIKTPNRRVFERVSDLARANTRVYVVSEKRLMLATDELPANIIEQMKEQGAVISEDRRYVPEVSPA